MSRKHLLHSIMSDMIEVMGYYDVIHDHMVQVSAQFWNFQKIG